MGLSLGGMYGQGEEEGSGMYVLDVVHLVFADVVAGFFEHLLGFGERDSDGVVTWWEEEVASFGVAGVFDNVDKVLAFRSGLEGADDEDHELFAKGEDFVVVVLKGHFEIEARKLGYWLVVFKVYM